MIGPGSCLESISNDAFCSTPFSRSPPLPLIQVSPEIIKNEEKESQHEYKVEALVDGMSEMRRLAYMGVAPDPNQSSCLEAMKKLLEADSDSMKTSSKDDMTIMHVYLKCGHADFETIKWLVKNDPDCILKSDWSGRYPIHYFCEHRRASLDNKTYIDMLRWFWRQSQGFDQVGDDDGMTPFALALEHVPWEVLVHMYSVEPSAPFGDTRLSILSAKDEYLESMLAKEKRPASLGEFTPDKQHGWVKFLGSHVYTDSKDEMVLAAMIRDTSRCPQESVEALAKAKTNDNRTAMDVATPEIKRALQERLQFLKRYDLDKGHVVHRSATCFVTAGKDAKMDEMYKGIYQKYSEKGDWMEEAQFEKFLIEYGFLADADTKSKEEVSRRFKMIDVDNSDSISEAEFVSYCLENLNQRVVLKFMRDEDAFNREICCREGLKSKHVLQILRAHIPKGGDTNAGSEKNSDSNSSKSQIPILEDVDMGNLPKFTSRFFYDSSNGNDAGTMAEEEAKEYKYILIMVMGDRSLDSIFRSERPDSNSIRLILKQIVEDADHLHGKGKGIIHGDIKPLNVVREAHTNSYKLIDLDAAVKIGKTAVQKFSSANTPPEALHRVVLDPQVRGKLELVEKYCKEQKIKFQYFVDKDAEQAIFVKSDPFAGTDFLKDERVKVARDAYYELLGDAGHVKASEAFDVWSLGCLAYTLCAEKTLFDANRDDDFNQFDVIRELYIWDEEIKEQKLKLVPDPNAQALLDRMLQKKPKNRPTLKKILEDYEFFDPKGMAGIHKKLDTVVKKLDDVADSLDKV